MIKISNFDLEEFLKLRVTSFKFIDVIPFIAIFLCGLLTYGSLFFDFSYNNDGLGRILYKSTANYIGGIQTGRWAYPFFFNIYNNSTHLPLINGLISVSLLTLCSFYLSKIFKIKKTIIKSVVGCVFISIPLMAHYFLYLGDSEVYATGVLLIMIAFYLLIDEKKNFSTRYFISMFLMIIAYACYPSLISITFTLSFCYAIYSLVEQKNVGFVFKKFTINLSIGLLSVVGYFLMTQLLLIAFDVKMTAYKNADEIDVVSLLQKLPFKIVWVYLLFIKYVMFGSIFLKIICSVGFFSFLSILIQNLKNSPKYFFFHVSLLLGLIPASLFIYLLTFEKWIYEGFLWGFLILIPFLVLITFDRFSKIIKSVMLIITLLFVFENIQINNTIILEYQLRTKSSQILTYNILQSIQETEGFNMEKDRIVFMGSLKNNTNYIFSSVIPAAFTLNGLEELPIGFNGYNPSKKIYNNLKILGFEINLANEKDIDFAEAYLINNKLPSYPNKGSIILINNLVVVNLGVHKEDVNHELKMQQDTEINREGFIEYIKSNI